MVEFKRRRRKKKVETRNYYCENIKTISGQCEVFINHRGSDTKKNIAGLLYDHLSRLGIKPFMDSRNMKPGDKLSYEIKVAIVNCKVAVALLSRNYCESRHCLHELALLMESNKRVLPIFWDVKPSELRVNINGRQFSEEEISRFDWALEQVKDTIGLTFNSSKGDWSEFLEVASKEVKNLLWVYPGRSMTDKRSRALFQSSDWCIICCSLSFMLKGNHKRHLRVISCSIHRWRRDGIMPLKNLNNFSDLNKRKYWCTVCTITILHLHQNFLPGVAEDLVTLGMT